MKQFYILLSAFLCTLTLGAQLTMSNHAPAAGEKHDRYQCDSTNIAPGPGGANQFWNFTVATRSSVVHSYTAGSSSNYPPATVSLSSNKSYEDHYKASSFALLDYSSSFPLATSYFINLNYNAPAVKAKYPMSLNTTSTTATNGYINAIMITPQAGSFSGTSTSVCDGSGTLVLPGNTYTNVLRVVNSETMTYVVQFNGTIILKNYDWYAPGLKQPVFSIITATLTRPSGTLRRTIVTRIKHVAPAPPVDLTTANEKMVCDNVSTTLTASGAGTIDWFDDIAATTAVGSGTAFVTPPLTPGVYTYYAESNNFLTSTRTAITFTVSDCTSLQFAAGSPDVKIFPNPSGAIFNIEVYEEYDLLNVFNAEGQLIGSQRNKPGINKLDLSQQPDGIYFVKVIKNNAVMSINKLVVQGNGDR